MLSALISSALSYRQSSGDTTGTPVVRPLRSSRTRSSPFQFSTPTADRDRTVSRRSKPSSRTALMGEQPNPWDLLQPQDATSRHRGAKPCRSIWTSWAGSACYPRGTFYPLSDGASTSHRRITSSYFRTCSTRQSHSQAPCALTLATWLPTRLREPLSASVTL